MGRLQVKMSLAVIVAGSRGWGVVPKDAKPPELAALKIVAQRERNMLISILDGLWTENTVGHLTVEISKFVVIEGHAPGADSEAHWWVECSPMHTPVMGTPTWDSDMPELIHHCMPADWNKYHKGAGPIRNKEMLKVLLSYTTIPQLVIAFHNDINSSKGTRNMCEQASAAGVPVYVYGAYKTPMIGMF